jgi:hypothetical protein
MTSLGRRERAALDQYEPRWVARGYTLVRSPRPEQLPGFLGDHQPDAIAIGKEPGLIIEVLGTRSRPDQGRAQRLHDVLKDRKDWRLEILYAPAAGPVLRSVTAHEIRQTVDRLRNRADADRRGALLVGWAALEAATRILEPDQAAEGLSSGSLVELLVGMGYLEQSKLADLWRLGEMRDAIVHGQIDLEPGPEDIRCLLDLVDEVMTVLEEATQAASSQS